MLDQVGPGNISVVAPPSAPHYHEDQSPFSGAPGGHPQYEDAPPDYSEDFPSSAFSDGAVRRGEQELHRGSDGSRKPFKKPSASTSHPQASSGRST